MKYIWPEIFKNPELVKSRDARGLCADVLSAWALCYLGAASKADIPKSFGTVLVAVANKLGMKKAPTDENMVEFAEEKGWLPKEEDRATT